MYFCSSVRPVLNLMFMAMPSKRLQEISINFYFHNMDGFVNEDEIHMITQFIEDNVSCGRISRNPLDMMIRNCSLRRNYRTPLSLPIRAFVESTSKFRKQFFLHKVSLSPQNIKWERLVQKWTLYTEWALKKFGDNLDQVNVHSLVIVGSSIQKIEEATRSQINERKVLYEAGSSPLISES